MERKIITSAVGTGSSILLEPLSGTCSTAVDFSPNRKGSPRQGASWSKCEFTSNLTWCATISTAKLPWSQTVFGDDFVQDVWALNVKPRPDSPSYRKVPQIKPLGRKISFCSTLSSSLLLCISAHINHKCSWQALVYIWKITAIPKTWRSWL